MRAFEGIEEVAVGANREDGKLPQLLAFCVIDPKNRATLTGDEVRAVCLRGMPRFAVPDRIVVLEELPRLANGKINRRQLEATYGSAVLSQ